MTRTEKVKKRIRRMWISEDNEQLLVDLLADISLTLAMIYDLMKEKESKNDSD